MFIIIKALEKYNIIKVKLIKSIYHHEIAPKNSEDVKAVATDLRNMLKKNNEIQAMRNLEERYHPKPLP